MLNCDNEASGNLRKLNMPVMRNFVKEGFRLSRSSLRERERLGGLQLAKP